MVWVRVRMVLMNAVRSYSRLLMEVGWHIIIEGFLFVKCFPDIRPDEAPPGQGEVEIFVAPKGRYLELENHGSM